MRLTEGQVREMAIYKLYAGYSGGRALVCRLNAVMVYRGCERLAKSKVDRIIERWRGGV